MQISFRNIVDQNVQSSFHILTINNATNQIIVISKIPNL